MSAGDSSTSPSRLPHGAGDSFTIRSVTPVDLAWVREELTRHWHGPVIASRDVLFQADALPGLMAESGGRRVGLLTFCAGAGEWEVITLSSGEEGRGVGTALLAQAAELARAAGAQRIFLTTSNDNLSALGFYQKRGWRLVAIHRGAMDRARAEKPGLPAVGMNGIPVHDEIELELTLGGLRGGRSVR